MRLQTSKEGIELEGSRHNNHGLAHAVACIVKNRETKLSQQANAARQEIGI
jgi:hypothetical protein